MKRTEYVNQMQFDGTLKLVRIVRTFPYSSMGKNAKPSKVEVLPLKKINIDGDEIT